MAHAGFGHTISSLSTDCCSVLDFIQEHLEQGRFLESAESIQDERGRFRVWAANVGCHGILQPYGK